MKITLTEKSPVGTCFNGTMIVARPVNIQKVFGDSESDDYKSAWEWIFEDDKGNIFTVYSWKDTSLYDSLYPKPEEIFNTPITFHIGSNNPKLEGDFVRVFETEINK